MLSLKSLHNKKRGRCSSLTCGVEASQLAVDAADVKPGGDLFAFLDASVGTQ